MTTRQTFTWYPDLASQRTMKPAVTQIKFGDGYEARVPNGINTMPAKWDVTFTRGQSEALAIDAFLTARGSSESFTWTDPKNVTAVFVCRAWTFSQREFGVYTITGTFEQVFEA